jgi:hypothetical protein
MKIIAWASGLIFTLCLVAFVTVMWLAAGEDICLDRKPWWGPPTDPNVYTSCSGHIYERRQAGYGWFGGPK